MPLKCLERQKFTLLAGWNPWRFRHIYLECISNGKWSSANGVVYSRWEQKAEQDRWSCVLWLSASPDPELRHGASVCCKCHRIKNSLGKEYSPRIHPGHRMEKAGRGETSIFNSHCVSLICTSKASYTLFATYIVCQQVICFRHSIQASVLFRIFFCEAFLKSTSYWKTFLKKIFLVIS